MYITTFIPPPTVWPIVVACAVVTVVPLPAPAAAQPIMTGKMDRIQNRYENLETNLNDE